MNLSPAHLFLLLISISFSAAFKSNAQPLLNRPVTLNVDGQPLRVVLSQINQQTSARFVYSSKFVNVNQRVTIFSKAKPLNEALNDLLKPQALTYRIVGGRIVLFKTSVVH
ncbi:STN domain-containing protein [Spirosoma gilvum]